MYIKTEEHRKKLSESLKGKNLGKRHSKLTRQKMSLSRKGCIPWNKGKMFPEFSGENSIHWKGGVTILRKKIRSHFKYRQWRSDIFERDDFTCQECGIRGGNLEAHHIKPLVVIMFEHNIISLEQAITCEELWNINNGKTLCVKCHDLTMTSKRIKNIVVGNYSNN
jgi:hypothetical protein